MKQILAIIILLGTALSGAAQYLGPRGNELAKFKEPIYLDSSYMECIYEYTVYDPVMNETRIDPKILAIGQHVSSYFDYGAYQIDSIRHKDYPNGITRNEYYKLSQSIHPSWEATVKDYAAATTKTYDHVLLSDNYVYEEPSNPMNWDLTSGADTICGYPCRKATTSFRGRNWTVWYCTDIPIDNGPWKFGGLPGLILKAESEDKEHKFEAIALRNNVCSITLSNRWYISTTREKLNKEMKEAFHNPGQFMIGNALAPKDKDGNIVKGVDRIFFNPIELE